MLLLWTDPDGPPKRIANVNVLIAVCLSGKTKVDFDESAVCNGE